MSGFTKVRSLVDGIAAIATAQIGDLVAPASLLTTVSQVDPIRAYFSLSETEYLRVADQINRAGPMRELWKTGGLLTLTLADETKYPQTGYFLAADRQIDPRTGTIRISAAFPNPKHVLRPGQYGRVSAADGGDDERASRPAARRHRAAGQVAGADGRRRQQGHGPDGDAGQPRRQPLDRAEGARIAGTRVIVDATTVPPGTLVKPKAAAPEAPMAEELAMAAFFIRRPIVAIVIAIVTVLGGLVSMGRLPVAMFPDIVPPADPRDGDLYRR